MKKNKKIVICGSRNVKNLFPQFEEDLNKIIEMNIQVLIGDAEGVDSLCQTFFISKEYENVAVYHCYDKPRNNKGFTAFPVLGGYRDRDIFMCDRADWLLALWDGISKGTKRNIDSFAKEKRKIHYSGINIYSKTPGFGGVLTNPTDISLYYKSIKQKYPVSFRGKIFKDAETAYKHHKQGDDSDGDLMTEIITSKLKQYPAMVKEITKRGGEDWLSRCSHNVNGSSRWEGEGLESWFISCLINAYKNVIII